MTTFLKQIYSEIARHYEKVNHIFTMGFDIYWRRNLARMVIRGHTLCGPDGPQSVCPPIVLDVCTGTGETARAIKAFSRGTIKVVGTDFSNEMLDEARRTSPDIEFKYADTARLPFPDESFDAVTVSFATRNLNNGEAPLATYFKEIRRVLKSGGVFYNLETSQPSNGIVRSFFGFYVKLLVVLIGKKFSGREDGYKYLAGSILTFMGPIELAEKLKGAGFSKVSYRRMLLGAAAIHTAEK